MQINRLFVFQIIAHLSVVPMIVYGQAQHYAIAFAVLYSSNSLRVMYKTLKYLWDCHVFEKDCSGTHYTEIRTVSEQEVEVYIQE